MNTQVLTGRATAKRLAAASLVVAGLIGGIATVSTAAAPFGDKPVTLQAQQGKVCTENAHTYPGGGSQGDTYACAGLRFSPDGKVVYAELRVEDNMFLNGNGAFVSGSDTQLTSVQFIVDGTSYPTTLTLPTNPTQVSVYEAALTLPTGAKKVQVAQSYQASTAGFRPGGPAIIVSKGSVSSANVKVPK